MHQTSFYTWHHLAIQSKWTLLQMLLCLLFSQTILAQGPPGYTLCASENLSFTLPAKSHVAYGADGKFKYLFNQTGTVTFSNDFFGGDPIFGVRKQGYYKLADGSETPAILSAALLKLKNHITGTTLLTAAQLNATADTIQQNIFVIADTITRHFFESKNARRLPQRVWRNGRF
jgi:hypothetical protein